MFSTRYCVDSVKHIRHSLFKTLQKYQTEFDSGKFIGTILMDLSKVYESLIDDFSIAKLEAYGLGNGSLNFLLDSSHLGNKELKLVPLLVNGQKLEGEFLKDQF